MKIYKIVGGLLVAVLLLSASGVRAQEETAKSDKPLAGYDNGFYLRSADDAFRLNIGGRMQVLHTLEKKLGLQKTATGTTPKTFDNTFSIRRAELEIYGKMFNDMDFWSIIRHQTRKAGVGGCSATKFNVDCEDDNNFIWRGNVTYHFIPAFSVTAGTLFPPFDREGESSSKWYLLTDSPLTATQDAGGVKSATGTTIERASMGMPLSLGVRIDGDVSSRFSYGVGVGNGSGGYLNKNTNNKFSGSMRVNFNVLDAAPYKETDFEWSESPKLSVGAGLGFENERKADSKNSSVFRRWDFLTSTDAAFRYRGWSVTGEVYMRRLKLSTKTLAEDTNHNGWLVDYGYYGQVGYYIVPHKLELGLQASQIFREGPDNNANEFGGVINWYILKNNLKLQLDYTNVLDYDKVPGLNNATYHRVRTMLSMFL